MHQPTSSLRSPSLPSLIPFFFPFVLISVSNYLRAFLCHQHFSADCQISPSFQRAWSETSMAEGNTSVVFQTYGTRHGEVVVLLARPASSTGPFALPAQFSTLKTGDNWMGTEMTVILMRCNKMLGQKTVLVSEEIVLFGHRVICVLVSAQMEEVTVIEMKQEPSWLKNKGLNCCMRVKGTCV